MANKIERYIEFIADELKIEIPEIRYRTKLQTDTMLAMADIQNGILFVKKNLSEDLDVFFSIAHEMRHLWQAKYKPEFFNGYRTVEECGHVDIYNAQVAEADANAYATTIMEDLFNVTPQFDGLSDAVKNLIYRMAELM